MTMGRGKHSTLFCCRVLKRDWNWSIELCCGVRDYQVPSTMKSAKERKTHIQTGSLSQIEGGALYKLSLLLAGFDELLTLEWPLEAIPPDGKEEESGEEEEGLRLLSKAWPERLPNLSIRCMLCLLKEDEERRESEIGIELDEIPVERWLSTSTRVSMELTF